MFMSPEINNKIFLQYKLLDIFFIHTFKTIAYHQTFGYYTIHLF